MFTLKPDHYSFFNRDDKPINGSSATPKNSQQKKENKKALKWNNKNLKIFKDFETHHWG